MLERISGLSRKEKIIAGVMVWLVAAGIIGIISDACESDHSREAHAEATAAREAEDRRKGFHCLSPWDGNHLDFKELVKDQLNDPDSMKVDRTRITPAGESGQHVISMDFRARNVFGGMVRSEARGLVDNNTCTATLLFIE